MIANTPKLSDIMKEMAQRLLRDPDAVPSSEAAHVALFFANVAWNECVQLGQPREGYRAVWETIEAENPALWNEFESTDVDRMIDELVEYKKAHYPGDQRRILTCGTLNDKVRVEWLAPAAPGVDSRWEMNLYGLLKTGKTDEAIEFIQQTRGIPRKVAATQVPRVMADLLTNSPSLMRAF